MASLMRFLLVLLKLIGYIVLPIMRLIFKCRIKEQQLPQTIDKLLKIPAVDLAAKIRNREITSEEVVATYIKRIKEVNCILNAVVSDRFDAALDDARRADKLIQSTDPFHIIKEYPLLGVPFTVKESCSLKGLSHCVGSVKRKNVKADKDGIAVANLRAAGAIPLLVSNTPEYCYNWESNNFVTGRTLNPYNLYRSSGGSSGGEGALIGSDASLFGVGSDIAGSIRIPAMFNGICGHKPTAELISLEGHFPFINDDLFKKFLVIGPMCRYAKDLPMILSVMAGENASKLRFEDPLYTKDINIYFLENFGSDFVYVPVQQEITFLLRQTIDYFKNNGLNVEKAQINHINEALEISFTKLLQIQNVTMILENSNNTKDNIYKELAKSLISLSNYTFPALVFAMFAKKKGLMRKSTIEAFLEKGTEFEQQLLKLLGDNGVLILPSYSTSASYHNSATFKIPAVTYAMIANWMGCPSTHVTLGRDRNGMPIGVQILAAPMQDRLSIAIAVELEAAFGSWKL